MPIYESGRLIADSRGVLRSGMEYPVVDVTFAYLAAINKIRHFPHSSVWTGGHEVLTYDSFTDKAVEVALRDKSDAVGRGDGVDDEYVVRLYSPASTKDFQLRKIVGGTDTLIAGESVDIGTNTTHLVKISISGSTIKGFRNDMETEKISATDTDLASGYYGYRFEGTVYALSGYDAMLRAPSSSVSSAQAIIEANFEGNGTPDEPYEPVLAKNLQEISSLTGLPDFLYQEAKKYEMLIDKGFTDEEIELLLGYIPQHQVDLNAITWGVFEFRPREASSVILIVVGDNPYQSGAIDVQKQNTLRSFDPPASYDDAISLYSSLKGDHPEWLAGKDNFAYQTLGHEVFELFAVADFYYGELIEHQTHYDQLKMVETEELHATVEMWKGRLKKYEGKLAGRVAENWEKHVGKIDEVLKS